MAVVPRFSTSTWGMEMYKLRRFYLSRVRPTIEYGCPIWFRRGENVRWQLSRALIDDLEIIQNQCLTQVAGAFKKTPREFLRKELYIQPLEYHLQQTASSQRARALGAEDMSLTMLPRNAFDYTLRAEAIKLRLDAQESMYKMNKALLEQNTSAKLRYWSDSKHRNRAINKEAGAKADAKAASDWHNWSVKRIVRPSGDDRPALQEDWGKISLGYYRGLTRAESSILLQCRVAAIGLRAHSYLWKTNVCGLIWVVCTRLIDLGHQDSKL